MNQRYLTRAEGAQYLTDSGFPTTKSTLEKLACAGSGPVYRLFGNRALYTPSDLDDWAESKLSAPRRSTSEAAA